MFPKLIKRKRLNPGYLASVDSLHEYAVEMIEDIYRKKGFAPFRWIMRVPPGELIIMDTPWQSRPEMFQHRSTMRVLMSLMGVQFYTFIFEGWMAVEQRKPGEPPDPKFLKVPPSQNPNSEDVVLVTTYDRSGTVRVTRYGVRYTKRRLGSDDLSPVGHNVGQFGRLLARDDLVDMDLTGGHMFDVLREPLDEIEARIASGFVKDFVAKHHAAAQGGKT